MMCWLFYYERGNWEIVFFFFLIFINHLFIESVGWVNVYSLYLCHPPKQGKTVEFEEYDSKDIVGELDQVAWYHRRMVEVISSHLLLQKG